MFWDIVYGHILCTDGYLAHSACLGKKIEILGPGQGIQLCLPSVWFVHR